MLDGNKVKGKYINIKNKKGINDKLFNVNLNWKIIIFIFTIIFCIFLYTKYIKAKDTKLLLIDGTAIVKSQFNIYAYSAKYNYFGSDLSNINQDDLEVIYDDTTGMTVKDYLKEVALNDIKTAYAIKSLADKYDINLTKKEKAKIEKEKKNFIDQLGGKKAFKKFLKQNKTNENAYNEMAYYDALYQKILDEKYSKGKINDLTPKEYEAANTSYPNEYYKIKQIILTTIDLESSKSLSNIAINQKEALANYIVGEARKGTNFDDLIAKYSEDSADKEPPYDLYYRQGTLLSELEDALQNLSAGNVSEPVKTKYAFHIILREELDDAKLEDYYKSLREEKYIKDLREVVDNQKVVYYKAYEKIEVE